MKVNLYRFSSGFSNVADRIEIKKEPYDSYSGSAMHAELDLPEGWQVVSTDYGDAIITDTDEIIEKVYAEKYTIAGTVYRGPVTIYSDTGKILLHCNVDWS